MLKRNKVAAAGALVTVAISSVAIGLEMNSGNRNRLGQEFEAVKYCSESMPIQLSPDDQKAILNQCVCILGTVEDDLGSKTYKNLERFQESFQEHSKACGYEKTSSELPNSDNKYLRELRTYLDRSNQSLEKFTRAYVAELPMDQLVDKDGEDLSEDDFGKMHAERLKKIFKRGANTSKTQNLIYKYIEFARGQENRRTRYSKSIPLRDPVFIGDEYANYLRDMGYAIAQNLGIARGDEQEEY